LRAERLTLTLIAISLPLSVLLSLSIGPYRSVDFPVVVAALVGLPVSRLSLDVLTYRAVRTLAAGVLGAGLASQARRFSSRSGTPSLTHTWQEWPAARSSG